MRPVFWYISAYFLFFACSESQDDSTKVKSGYLGSCITPAIEDGDMALCLEFDFRERQAGSFSESLVELTPPCKNFSRTQRCASQDTLLKCKGLEQEDFSLGIFCTATTFYRGNPTELNKTAAANSCRSGSGTIIP
jgi:hypothetical protein